MIETRADWTRQVLDAGRQICTCFDDRLAIVQAIEQDGLEAWATGCSAVVFVRDVLAMHHAHLAGAAVRARRRWQEGYRAERLARFERRYGVARVCYGDGCDRPTAPRGWCWRQVPEGWVLVRPLSVVGA